MRNYRGMFFGVALFMAMASTTTFGSESYGEVIGMKAASGFSNLALGWLELPKNVVATTNQTNLAVGLTGGTVKGIVHTAGRILCGAADLLTFPFPTKSIAQPEFVWQNFGVETRYGPVFVGKEPVK